MELVVVGIPDEAVRRRVDVRGRVQGVGFRPYVWRLARELDLAGLVGNDASGVFVEVEGPSERVAAFVERLPRELPGLARITGLLVEEREPRGDTVFTIAPSEAGGRRRVLVPPDTALCEDCRRELHDPSDRRHRYPFVNCTNCGPRYTIIRSVPYDRPATTMAGFPMCADCRREYEDPGDRRFHAQPVACPVCGPRVRLVAPDGDALAGDPMVEAALRLREGAVVALKGLGGFHLACRADDDTLVLELRRRKGRDTKPLAVMVPDLAWAERLVHLDDASREALTGVERPIVVAPRREDASVASSVAPGTGSLGVMLPYTPLHELLLGDVGQPLVMTSGNPSAEPLCFEDDEALARLGGMADFFLLHDRPIERPLDDSVVVAVPLPGLGPDGRDEAVVVPLRRARGYVPVPVEVAVEAPAPILAMGADLKAAVCVLQGREATLGEHLGELANPRALRHFVQAGDRIVRLLGVTPEVVAVDLHPDYASSRHGRSLGLPVEEVQHHHAHAVACMAENGLTGSVVAVVCDGTGYGPDGSIWGGEIFVCDEGTYARRGCLRPFPLVGGDAAARETWRPALALVRQTWGDEWRSAVGDIFAEVPAEALALTEARLGGSGRLVTTSSLGRVFDAVAFLLGLVVRNGHEAEAAMALEACGSACGSASAEPHSSSSLSRSSSSSSLSSPILASHGLLQIDLRPLVRALVEGRQGGEAVSTLARSFHLMVAQALAETAASVASSAGLDRVVLSGGCFVNRLLLGSVAQELRRRGLAPFVHRAVPTGDGGVALGQAVCAAARRRVSRE